MSDNPTEGVRQLTRRTGQSVAITSSHLVIRGLNELAASEEAEQRIRADAVSGKANAQYELGRRYRERGDNFKAVMWFGRAAEQDHVDARLCLKHVFEAMGRGMRFHQEQSFVDAAQCYRLAAEMGETYSAMVLGRMYNEGEGIPQDRSEALRWFRLMGDHAIEESDTNLMRHLGLAYSFPNGILVDQTESFRWYQEAADRGDTEGMCELADCYSEDRGVQRNFGIAAEWYRRAAEKGYFGGQAMLGVLYHLGLGVRKDHVKAYAWTKRSMASTGSLLPWPGAEERLKSMTEKMTPDEIAEAERLIYERNPW
jgi:TPR repeat protein